MASEGTVAGASIITDNNKVTDTSDIAGYQKFYNSPTCSDVQILFPRNAGVVSAHKFVLAAGSGYFNRKLQESEYMEERVVTFHADGDDVPFAMSAAIKYMYGFEFHGDPYPMSSTSLYHYASICAMAEKYEVAGLLEAALQAAQRALVYCLSDEAELREFLGTSGLWAMASSTYPRDFVLAVRILGHNLTALRKKAAFQELLEDVPKLAIDLLNLVAEEKDELERKQKKVEDLE